MMNIKRKGDRSFGGKDGFIWVGLQRALI